MKQALIFVLFSINALLFVHCDNSPNEPEEFGILDIALNSTDSVIVKLDDQIICEGKVNYTGILGVSWFNRFEDKSVGIHKIYYKSYLYNKEVEHKFYLEDTLTVTMYYSSQHDQIEVFTRNKELWLD